MKFVPFIIIAEDMIGDDVGPDRVLYIYDFKLSSGIIPAPRWSLTSDRQDAHSFTDYDIYYHIAAWYKKDFAENPNVGTRKYRIRRYISSPDVDEFIDELVNV